MFGRTANQLDDLSEVDCLLCGSQQSCDRMLYSDREEWSKSICNLLSISDPEVVQMFATSYYCGKCNDDLRKVNQFLHQIAELNEKLHNIKSRCVFKLDHCIEESKEGRCSTFPTHVQRRAHILPYLKGTPMYCPVSSGSQIVHVISDEIVRAMSNQMINISSNQILVSPEHLLTADESEQMCNDNNTTEVTEEILNVPNSSEVLLSATTTEQEQHLLNQSTPHTTCGRGRPKHIFSNQKIILSELDGTLSVELVMTDQTSQSENEIIHESQIPGPHPHSDSWFPQDNFVENEIEIKTDTDFAPCNVGSIGTGDRHSEDGDCLPQDLEERSENDSHSQNSLCPATVAFDQNRSIIEQAMELANNDLVSRSSGTESNLPSPVFPNKTKHLDMDSTSIQNNFSESLAETELALNDRNRCEFINENQAHQANLEDPDEGVLEASRRCSAVELAQSITTAKPKIVVGKSGNGTKIVYDEAYPSDEESMNIDKDPFTLSDQEEDYGSSVSTLVSEQSDGEDEAAREVTAHNSTVQGQLLSPSSFPAHTEWDEARYKELKTKYKLKDFSIRLQRPWVIKIVNIASLLKQCNSASATAAAIASASAPSSQNSNSSYETCATNSSTISTTNSVNQELASTLTTISDNSDAGSSQIHSEGIAESSSGPNITVQDFFQCTVEGCRMRFRFEIQRDAHVRRLHEGVKRPYQCSICNITFVTYKQFSFHENSHEGQHPFQCITCSRSYESRLELVDHIDITGHHADSLLALPCPEEHCSKKFIDEIRRDAHVKKFHEGIKNPYECTTCLRKFPSYGYLKDHMNHHANVNPYTCEICSRKFYSQLRLKEHAKCHGPKNLQCEYCGKEFVLKGRYNVHIRTHTKERPYACEVCGKRFTQRKYLRYHLPIHPELNLERAVCKICNKVFSHHQTLRIHELQHTGEFKYRCTICNFGAPSQYALKNHMAKHTENREYTCELCDKKFKTNKYLKMHVKQQHGENRSFFECKSCGKKLRSRIGLLRHEALHGDSFPFVCSKCGKCYPLKYYLDSHTVKCIKKEAIETTNFAKGNKTEAEKSTSVTLRRKRKGRRQPQEIGGSVLVGSRGSASGDNNYPKLPT